MSPFCHYASTDPLVYDYCSAGTVFPSLVLLEWLSFIFASVCSFVDVNPTFQFLKHLSYSGHSFNIVCFLFVLLFSFLFCTSLNSSRVVQLCFCFSLSPPFLRISIEFPSLFSTEISSRFTRSESIALPPRVRMPAKQF